LDSPCSTTTEVFPDRQLRLRMQRYSTFRFILKHNNLASREIFLLCRLSIVRISKSRSLPSPSLCPTTRTAISTLSLLCVRACTDLDLMFYFQCTPSFLTKRWGSTPGLSTLEQVPKSSYPCPTSKTRKTAQLAAQKGREWSRR
jgi:hypothetical protein